MPGTRRKLELTFHGRVLEHLGIQMYQSPVSALSELVANAWDANAETVSISLPSQLRPASKVVIADDGHGMTFEECQDHFLNVGRNRRGGNATERTPAPKSRPILGRKGIGKFAGFGIAERIVVATTSASTGERTVFELDLQRLTSHEAATRARGSGARDDSVTLLEYEGPSRRRRNQHGTTITLSRLTLGVRPSAASFARSMARRFLLHQRVADFTVSVNRKPLPDTFDLAKAEFAFPRDYRPDELPRGLTVDADGWGHEQLANGRSIRWQFVFLRDTIDEEELRGIAVFANGKLAQAPFLFNITKGLGGQHGVEYLSGQVEADYIDTLAADLIATERQRLNWNHGETLPLQEWGQQRVRDLLSLWVKRRNQERVRSLEAKLASFSPRIGQLQRHEAQTVRGALRQLAKIPTLSKSQYEELGGAVLTAWERGRLQDLIADIASVDELSESDLLKLLVEANVLSALNTAEAVRTKLDTVRGLALRIEQRELELAVRDYIAKNPWLIEPQWETFRVERGVMNLLRDAARYAELHLPEYAGRVDLALASGRHLLVIEFVRPGKSVDWDHLSRFERYVEILRTGVAASTHGEYRDVTGYLVADALAADAAIAAKIRKMRADDMRAMDWKTLFRNAGAAWREFLDTLGMRGEGDHRLTTVVAEATARAGDGGHDGARPRSARTSRGSRKAQGKQTIARRAGATGQKGARAADDAATKRAPRKR